MRRFLLLAHRVPVDGSFTLNDLAGGGGRMDEVARVVSTAFTTSNALRRDTRLTILFVAAPPPQARRIDLDGERLRYLNPDERSTAALLKNALVRSSRSDARVDASPGLSVAPVEPADAIRSFAGEPNTFWLREGEKPLTDWNPTAIEFGAILGDASELTREETHWVEATGVAPVSLGARPYRASQCVDVVHHEFDRRSEAIDPREGPAPPG